MPFRPSASATRRHFVGMSALGGLGMLWPDWARAEAAGGARAGTARAVILIFNCGAPSHLDLWDLKPDAPDTVRGKYKPIATNVPGIRIGELMPRLACRADKLAIIRTLHHQHRSHNSGMYWSIVGRPYPRDSTLINPSHADLPSFGTLVGWLARRDGYSGALPPYVITPAPHRDSNVYITPGQFGGCLGARHDPFVLDADPNAADFRVPNLSPTPDLGPERLGNRRELLGHLNRPQAAIASVPTEFDVNRDKAFSMLASDRVQHALDLTREPESVRERYGRHSWGQSHLLARRLVEAGVKFVTTVNGPSITWDTHKDNFERLEDRLVPPMERAFVALLDDLESRGLLDSTLVVWLGDFGRTPLINQDGGRDHWPPCYSAVLAGGGIRGGQVIGVSDAMGAYPKERPVTPADLHATVFTALGYDPHAINYSNAEGRPYALSEGQAIRELL